MKKLKKMMLYLFSFLLLLGVIIILFINIDPAFGGNPTIEQKEFYQHSNNYVDGKFINEDPAELVINSSDASSTNEDSASEAKDRNPTDPIPVSAIDWNKTKSENDSLTWFGHSAFYLVLIIKSY
jgi:cytoskeletal protein RodZ